MSKSAIHTGSKNRRALNNNAKTVDVVGVPDTPSLRCASISHTTTRHYFTASAKIYQSPRQSHRRPQRSGSSLTTSRHRHAARPPSDSEHAECPDSTQISSATAGRDTIDETDEQTHMMAPLTTINHSAALKNNNCNYHDCHY